MLVTSSSQLERLTPSRSLALTLTLNPELQTALGPLRDTRGRLVVLRAAPLDTAKLASPQPLVSVRPEVYLFTMLLINLVLNPNRRPPRTAS